MSKIKILYEKYKEIILYLFFGVVTTVASLAVCYLTLKVGVIFWHNEKGEPTRLLDVLGSVLQWVSGVLVAFYTNKKWVFTKAQKGKTSTARQLAAFSGARVSTLLLEIVINLAVIAIFDSLGYVAPTISLVFFSFALTSRIWAKLISSVLVVVSNYFLSKFFVFSYFS